jgi:hypothetical protein
MIRINLFVSLLILLFSCKEKKEDKDLKTPVVSEKKTAPPIEADIRKCIDNSDTLLDNNTSVKYVVVDTSFTVKLTIDGIDTLLGYRFDCRVPGGLVPELQQSYNNKLCLLRGSGQHYREYLIAYTEKGKINIKYYEIALATDLKNDLVVYQDYDSLTNVVIENFKTGKKKIIVLPDIYSPPFIINSSIKRNILRLEFSDGKTFRSPVILWMQIKRAATNL